MNALVDLSVVVPVHDEEQNLEPLHAEIARALSALGVRWEVLYVDDCSTDRSLQVMLRLRAADPHVRVVCFRNNAGQTAAMAAGFDHSRGELVVTLDGDLQNDPADIPRLVAEIEKGYDIVAGWRKARQDGLVLRRLPSIAANRLIAWVTGVRIHDTGCSLKVFRRELVRRLPIYAEQHRFLPAMSAGSGARVGEVVVNHRPRRFGRSKYGLGRATRVLLDLLTIKMIASFAQRPLQYFTLLALPFAVLSAVQVVLGLLRLPQVRTLAELSGYVAPTFLCLSVCVYFFLLGLLAELAVRAGGRASPAAHGPLAQAADPTAWRRGGLP